LIVCEVDRRRRKAERAQSFCHRDEGADILGEMRDGAIGLAVAHRRTVGPWRRVHQNVALVIKYQAFIGSGGGVALQVPPLRLAESALLEELAGHRHPPHARGEPAMAGHLHVAESLAALRRHGESDVETVGRQETGGAVRPFQQHQRFLRQVVEAKLRQLGRVRDAVKIGMDDGQARQIVGLDQRKGRAGDFDTLIAREVADQRPGERGLACAEIAGERDQVSWLQADRDFAHEAAGRRLIRQLRGKT
jgi:hypothetical protein